MHYRGRNFKMEVRRGNQMMDRQIFVKAQWLFSAVTGGPQERFEPKGNRQGRISASSFCLRWHPWLFPLTSTARPTRQPYLGPLWTEPARVFPEPP